MTEMPSEYVGWWRITETSQWANEHLDDLEKCCRPTSSVSPRVTRAMISRRSITDFADYDRRHQLTAARRVAGVEQKAALRRGATPRGRPPRPRT